MIEIYFDGACEPWNPKGIATYGYVVIKNGKTIKKGKGLACEPFSYQSSNNVAEYTAMIKALEFLVSNGLTDDEVIVKGDSQLTIRQMNGVYSVKADRIIPLYKEARELARKFRRIRFVWIPREQNEVADELSHQAYVEYIDANPEILKKISRSLATEKQKRFLDKLGIKYDKYIGKREASRLISRALRRRD
ncbi:ribonuclease H [Archaeoglobales archaeon]|nr:MAG: ribonuclease H [Archaeoglobales archaeon]